MRIARFCGSVEWSIIALPVWSHALSRWGSGPGSEEATILLLCEQNDRRFWKHYLPATSFEGSNGLDQYEIRLVYYGHFSKTDASWMQTVKHTSTVRMNKKTAPYSRVIQQKMAVPSSLINTANCNRKVSWKPNCININVVHVTIKVVCFNSRYNGHLLNEIKVRSTTGKLSLHDHNFMCTFVPTSPLVWLL